MFSEKDRKHIWSAIETINDLSDAVTGLSHVVERLLHPSVVSHDGLRQLWTTLERVHNVYSGHVDLDEITRIIMTRLEEHCQAVRNFALGTISTVQPLEHWNNRSEPLLEAN